MNLAGWGKYPQIQAKAFLFETKQELRRTLAADRDYIVHAMGRSYGDSSLNHSVLLTRRFNNILDFDSVNGIAYCESGVNLDDLIEVFLPRGWFPKVVPGTRFVSVGGAIASDVHGKNHHQIGCFSEIVRSLDLMLASGEIIECNRERNRELFLATCGGMGLTGVILGASIQLMPVSSEWIREKIIRSEDLEETLSLFDTYRTAAYSAAWVDCAARGKSQGRSLLILGEHATEGKKIDQPSRRFSIPFACPGFCLNKYVLSLFNQFYYSKARQNVTTRILPASAFFFPLDSIQHWNRLYGQNGFIQYQLVLPRNAGCEGLQRVFARIAKHSVPVYLGVLKLFGRENDNYLTFPMEGYTLALDFKFERRLLPFLKELDCLILDYGGRLYLAKDARMPVEVFRSSYPNSNRFAKLRKELGLNRKFNSLQSRRLGI